MIAGRLAGWTSWQPRWSGPVALLLAISGWLGGPSVVSAQGAQPGPAPARWVLASFTERDVAVELTLERDQAGRSWLSGRFSPTRPSYHLYDINLPAEGIRGLGRPTLLAIVPPGPLRPDGVLKAEQATVPMRVPALGLTFPVYPAGPVTLRLPVALSSTGDRQAELTVTYMACSDQSCDAPVVDKHVKVMIPKASLE